MYISILDEENIFLIPLMKYSDIRKDKFRRFLPARWFFLQCAKKNYNFWKCKIKLLIRYIYKKCND